MLVDEQHVLLEARVEMGLQAKFPNHWVMVAVDVRIHAVHALKDLAHESREGLGERDACLESASYSEPTGLRDLPMRLGSTASLSMLLWTQLISCSIYAGAGIFVGRL